MTKALTIEDLRPDPRNANKGTPRGHGIIEQSVRQRGAGRSGLAAADGTMIAGSQTLQKMAELGIPIKPVHTNGKEWVVVIRDDIEPGSEEAALLAVEDNRSSEVGLEWDASVLAELAQEADLSSLFFPDELAAMLAEQAEVPTAEEDEPVAPNFDAPTEAQPGDVWKVGRHVVACLDSTEPGNLDRVLAGRRPNMLVADPPYGMSLDTSYSNSTTNTKRGINKSRGYAPIAGDDEEFNPSLFLEMFRDVQEHFWWGGDYYRQYLPVGGSWLVWDKRAGLPDFDYSSSEFELCWSKTAHLREILRVRWFGAFGMEQEGGAKRVHPSQKPIAVYEELYKHGSAGDLIFDPFLGSGPSLKAAEQSGRTVIGCELSPHYVDHILGWARAAGLDVTRHG